MWMLTAPRKAMSKPSTRRWSILMVLAFLNVALLVGYGTAPFEIVVFAAVVMFCTIIPGWLVMDILRLYSHTAYRLALGVAVGICLDILVFGILSALQQKWLLYVVFTLFLVLYLYRSAYRRDLAILSQAIRQLSNKHYNALALLAATVPAIIVILYFLPNPLPGSEEAVIYYIDYPWHIANIAEIKNHWYPQDPRLAGFPFHYHIFIYLYLGMLSYVGGLDIPTLFLRLYVVFLIYLLLAAAYFSATQWHQRRGAGLINIALFLLIGACLFSFPGNLFLKDLFLSPTLLLAVILALFLVSEIRTYLRGGEPAALVVLLLLVTGVSGAKGSFFPVILGGLGLCTVYSLWRKQSRRKLTLLALSSLVVFLAVYQVIYQGPGGEGINIIPLEIIRRTYLFQAYLEYLHKLENGWLMMAFIPVYLMGFFSFRLLALLELGRLILRGQHHRIMENIFAGGTIAASFLFAYTLDYRGSSQYFFLFAGYLFLNILSAGYLQRVFTSGRNKLGQAVLLGLLVIAAGDTAVTLNEFHDHTINMLAYTNKPLTPALYEGLLYLRDNSDKDATVAAYRSYWLSKQNPRFFYHSAFSERRMLAEGWQYMSLFRQEEAMQRHEQLKILFSTRDPNEAGNVICYYGIDYVLVNTAKGQRLHFPANGLLTLEFENDEVEVYRVSNRTPSNHNHQP